MKFDNNLTAIHAYLCADGYVIKNPKTQKQKYYKVGLRNTNPILLSDFQNKFEQVFGIKPHLRRDGRCEIGSKEIYERLIKRFGSFHSHVWKIPELNNRLLRVWLRSYFDCEGWVFCKSHQNRHIGADCINKNGMKQVIESLNKLGIKNIRKFNKKRKMHRVLIYGKENLLKFKKEIGFLHPDKDKKLDLAIKDYVEYKWVYPKNEFECKRFIINLLKSKMRIKKPYHIRLFSNQKENLELLKKSLKKYYRVNSLLNKYTNGIGTIYYELNISKKAEIQKLINLKIIPNILKNV